LKDKINKLLEYLDQLHPFIYIFFVIGFLYVLKFVIKELYSLFFNH